MKIEVGHDPLALPFKARLRVFHARAAEVRLNNFCDTKHDRGYRLRFVPDIVDNTIELGARQLGMLEAGIQCLKEGGLVREHLPWHTNRMLLRGS